MDQKMSAYHINRGGFRDPLLFPAEIEDDHHHQVYNPLQEHSTVAYPTKSVNPTFLRSSPLRFGRISLLSIPLPNPEISPISHDTSTNAKSKSK
jgi:hypothetical protein